MKIGDLVRYKKSSVHSNHAKWVRDAAENKTPFLIVSVLLGGRAIEVLYGQKLWFIDSCDLTSGGSA